MKKDKEKRQPVTETTEAEEQKISSAALTFQLLNKEKERNKEAEKKDLATESAKVRCRVCFKEISPKRLCSGHGGGGGGGEGDSPDETLEETTSPNEDKLLAKPRKVDETTDEMIDQLDSNSSFDPEIIAALIAKGLLLVDSDRSSMTLSIKLLCEPNELNNEQREEFKKFMTAIVKECNEFKKTNHLSDDCMKIVQDEKGNVLSLRITMPTLALYDAFIQRLANHLVPIPSPKAQIKDEVTKEQGQAPNPLSMEPKPSKREELEPNKEIEPKKAEEEAQQIFNPSPFNTKPW